MSPNQINALINGWYKGHGQKLFLPRLPPAENILCMALSMIVAIAERKEIDSL